MTKDVIIELKNVWKTYTMGDAEVHALKGLTLQIKKGEFLAIMGPSGSGKSTAMNMIAYIFPACPAVTPSRQGLKRLNSCLTALPPPWIADTTIAETAGADGKRMDGNKRGWLSISESGTSTLKWLSPSASCASFSTWPIFGTSPNIQVLARIDRRTANI